MRIALLCKRVYSGKDVIGDRFGRLYALAEQLALLGHEIHCFCLDYHGHSGGRWHHSTSSGILHWESYPTKLLDFFSFPPPFARLNASVGKFAPDILIGASDIPHLALTQWLANKLDRPYVVDLYDNFESFGQARIPGFRALLIRSIQSAGLVIAVSEPLKRKVLTEYAPRAKVLVMPNAVDANLFSPGSRTIARKQLKLPIDGKLLGTAGGLSRKKGIEALYAAWATISAEVKDAHLVLAGPVEAGHLPPPGKRVHFLGSLPQEQVAALFRALDVGIVTVQDDAFGRYCFPQKVYEMMACGLPIIASDVGVMHELLSSTPQALYPPGSATGLAGAVLQQLRQPSHPDFPIPSWTELVTSIEHYLMGLASSKAPLGIA